MRVWLVTCAILFVAAQFISWVKQFFLPLPIAILAGAFLAIASNYEKGILTAFSGEPQSNVQSSVIITQTATIVEEIAILEGEEPKAIEGSREEN